MTACRVEDGAFPCLTSFFLGSSSTTLLLAGDLNEKCTVRPGKNAAADHDDRERREGE